MSEYAEMSSSDIPLNGSSDPAGSAAAGGSGSGSGSGSGGVGSGLGGSGLGSGSGSGGVGSGLVGSGSGSGSGSGGIRSCSGGTARSGLPSLIHARMSPARRRASLSVSGGGTSSMSEYAEMSSSDIPLNGSSDPAGSAAAGGSGSGLGGSGLGSGSGSGAFSGSSSWACASASAAGEISVSRTLVAIFLSTICRSPNSTSRNDSFLNGSRSPYSWPTPRNSMGLDVTFTIDRAAPPLASASLFVSMEQSNRVYSWNS